MDYLRECIEQGVELKSRYVRIRNYLHTSSHGHFLSHDALMDEILALYPNFRNSRLNVSEIDAGFVQITFPNLGPFSCRRIPSVLFYGEYDGLAPRISHNVIRAGREETQLLIARSLRGDAIVRSQI